MLKNLIPAIVACLLFNAITIAQNTTKVDSAGMLTLRIDPNNSRGAAVSQVFDDVKFIPLETNKESLFGSISQLDIVDGNFVIFDWDTKSVLIFGSDGKFKAKINASKMDTEKESSQKESAFFWGFAVKKEGSETYITISSGKYVFYFDLKGQKVKKTPIKDAYDKTDGFRFADSITIASSNYILKQGNDSTYFEISLLKNKEPKALYFPYNANRYKEDDFFGGDGIVNYGVPNELFYLRSYDFNIYKITPDKLSLAYRVILPAAYSLPLDFLTNPVYKKKRREYFDKNRDVYYSLNSTYKTGNKLFLKMNSMYMRKETKNALIYHLNTGELTSISDIQPDSLSSFLPVTDAGSFYDFISRGFLSFKDGYLYTSYSSLAMFTFKEQSAAKNAVYPPALAEYFKTGTKQNNPVIIALKPKKD